MSSELKLEENGNKFEIPPPTQPDEDHLMDTGTLSKHGGAEMLATDNSESGNLPLETKEELVS